MSLTDRNAYALKACQSRYDNQSPEDDDGRQDYIDKHVGDLLDGDDSIHVKFFTFAEAADEAIAETDDREFAIVQLVLAARSGNFDLAHKLALRFEDALIRVGEKLVEEALENNHD